MISNPGFTAEALDKTNRHYVGYSSAIHRRREVLPQLSIFDRECYDLCTSFFSGFGNVTPHDCRRLCTLWRRDPSDFGI